LTPANCGRRRQHCSPAAWSRVHRRARCGPKSTPGEISLRRRGSQRPCQHGMVEAVSTRSSMSSSNRAFR
jgi:hypothetical protein